MKVGDRIRQVRKQNGLSQSEFGKLLGISKPTVCKYEQNRTQRIPSDVIEQICLMFGCDPLWLMGFDDASGSLVTEDRFKTELKALCNKWENIGKKFNDNDYQDIANYIKFKASQK